MTRKWRTGDLIDLEYFLREDDIRKNDTEGWDRKTYLEYMDRETDKVNDRTPSFRRELFGYWLEKRKSRSKRLTEDGSSLPGEVFEEVYRVLVFAFLILGLATGAGIAFSVLEYDGTRPINVTVYIGIFVIFQIVLILLVVIFSLLAHKRGQFSKVSIIYRAMGNVLSKVVLITNENTIKKLSAEKQNGLKAAIGLARGKHRIYGSVFNWPVFILIQVASIGFQVGVLLSTILRVLSRDLAFGWESTIQLSSETIFNLVRTISAPWSWICSQEIAYPTLEQIVGSKIVLKNGIYNLATQDLVSWWPFLCLSVLCYGLFPRIALLCVGSGAKRRALSGFGFDNAACEKLLIRMKTPGLSTHGQPERLLTLDTSGEKILAGSSEKYAHTREPSSGIVVLVPADIFELCSDEKLREEIQRTFGANLIEKIEVGNDPDIDIETFRKLAESKPPNSHPNVVILQEAWLPPIQETRLLFQEARQELGERIKIIVALVGKPKSGNIFTMALDQDKRIWTQEIAKLGDPYIWVADLCVHATTS